MLPVGQSDLPNQTTVNLFCPKCKDIYFPPHGQGNIDGAYFGTTFPHVFLMRYPAVIPEPPHSSYEPRVYGFRVHKSSPISPIYGHGEAAPDSVKSSETTKEKGAGDAVIIRKPSRHRSLVIMPRGMI